MLAADNKVGDHQDNGEDGSSTWGRRAAPGTTGTTTTPTEKTAMGMARTDKGTTTRKTKKKGPRDDVNVVSWAIGQFFFLSSFHFLY